MILQIRGYTAVMRAIIISAGDELILGQTIDTNSAWLSRELASIGCLPVLHQTVGDDQAATARAISESAARCDVIIITGGLGPTADDLTRQALADVAHQPLEIDDPWLRRLEAFFRLRKRPMPESNRIQAMLPRGGTMLFNPRGTAGGIYLRIGNCDVFSLPGVPSEMQEMFAREVSPRISAISGGAVIASRTLHTFGWPESMVGEKLGALMDRARNPSVGTTVSRGLISLRINARFSSRAQADDELDTTETLCREALGELIFGRDEQSLPAIVGEMLVGNSQKLATAESCTGGLLTKMLTDIPGSSRYVERGWITYSNESKTQTLGVPLELIAANGAVSEQVAGAMADGARTRSGADFALSITGIAGPDGGTPEKPVGTVCFGFAHSDGVQTRTVLLPGEREFVRERAANFALSLLRFHLLGLRMPF